MRQVAKLAAIVQDDVRLGALIPLAQHRAEALPGPLADESHAREVAACERELPLEQRDLEVRAVSVACGRDLTLQ